MTDKTNANDTNEPVAFDERTRRVLELRRQIADGTYHVDAEQVAKAMLREWAEVAESLAEPASRPEERSESALADARARFIVPAGASGTEPGPAAASARSG